MFSGEKPTSNDDKTIKNSKSYSRIVFKITESLTASTSFEELYPKIIRFFVFSKNHCVVE